MANTYTQLYVHITYAVQNRHKLIPSQHKDELHKYLTGIVQNQGNKMIVVNSMPDHVHLLAGWNPKIAISDLVRELKSESSAWINEHQWLRGKFNWQDGFAAFSYSRSQLPRVIRYIQQQERHHRTRTFREECRELFEAFGIEYDERYLPGW